jgi:uncharacterized membrane protein YgcG
MSRFSLRRTLVALVAACLASLFAPASAWAKFVPPPLPDGDRVVTMVGWLSPADQRKVTEQSKVAEAQTGYVIEVILAPNDAAIDEVASETMKAWAPGDPTKENGVILAMQPNFPRGERKVRIAVGRGVRLTEKTAKSVMKDTMGPLINGTDEVRTAVASGIIELAKALGADANKSQLLLVDAGPDGSAVSLAPSSDLAAPPPATTKIAAVPSAPPDEGNGMFWMVLGVLIVGAGGTYVLTGRRPETKPPG